MAVERIKAWQCIGCGRVEGLQTCIGVCQDRRVEFVHAEDYEALATHVKVLDCLVRQIASITPREGEWERCYRALQLRARQTLAAFAREHAEAGSVRD